MRILVLNYEFPPLGGGAGNATAELVCSLGRRADVEVTVVTSSVDGFRASRREFTDNSTIYYLPVGKRGRNLHYQTDRELLCYVVACQRFLRRHLRTERYDLCHAIMGLPAGLNAWLVRGRMPYLVSLQGSDVPGYSERFRLRYKLLTPIIRRIWRDAVNVVANSSGLRELALRAAPAQEIAVIPNGVDRARFHPGARDPLRPDALSRIICVGRLIERKGLWDLAQAFAAVAEALPQAHLDLVGSGKLEQSLRAWVGARGLETRVTLHGAVPREALPALLRRATVFALPSHAEGMSNALLEGMACGLPVVVTDTGGTRELVDGNGLVVPARHPKSLAAALIRLLSDDAQRLEAGLNSLRIAESLSWEALTERYLELYGHAPGKRAARLAS